MASPTGYKFNNTVTNDNIAVETAMTSAITAPIDSSLNTALTNFVNALIPVTLPVSHLSSGRITFSTGVPVLNSNVAGATSHFFTPYNGQAVPIWNGTKFIMTDMGGELSQAATDTTKSPAAVVASTLYDIFVWSDSGTIRATRGPAWSNSGAGSGARGSGAGTTELNLVNGYYVNKNAITNGPAAGFGTYVGTILSDASSTYTFNLGGSASGGTAAVISMWNYFNRINLALTVTDSGASYTYSSSTIRQARASAGMQATIVIGLNETPITFSYTNRINLLAAANANAAVGIGVDSTSTVARAPGIIVTVTAIQMQSTPVSMLSTLPAIGMHIISANEQSDGSNLNTFAATASGASTSVLTGTVSI